MSEPNPDYEGQRGAGLGRLAPIVSVPDHLAPVEGAPVPAEGYPGPTIPLTLDPAYLDYQAKVDQLSRELLARRRPDIVAGVATDNTDSSGNLTTGLYQVAAGMEATLRRVVVNCVKLASNTFYTPDAGYQASGATLGLYQADQNVSGSVEVFGTGLIDYAPETELATATGAPIFPYVFSYSRDQVVVHGPQWIVLQVNAGPHATRVMARYWLELRRQRGLV